MRFFSTIVAALAVAQGTLAVDVQKSIIVSFPEGTPDDVVSRAKDEIRQAGGVVTHDYKLFKGFSAHAPQKIVESVSVWATDYQGTIEEDQVVTISENGPAL